MHTVRIPPADPTPATTTAVLAMHDGHICPSLFRVLLFVVELRVPVGAATFRREIQHLPKRVQVWGTPRVLARVRHRRTHLAAIEVANSSAAPDEYAEAGHI